MDLLPKVYQIEAMIQKGNVDTGILVKSIADFLGCKVYLVNPTGGITHSSEGQEGLALIRDFKEHLKSLHDDVSNIPIMSGFIVNEVNSQQLTQFICISRMGELGHLLLVKDERAFNAEELVMIEVLSIATEIHIKEKQLEPNPKLYMVLNSLTYMEKIMLGSIFKVISANDGFFKAKEIANMHGIGHATVVNGLNKLEIGGVITRRSLGTKGVYIKILEPEFIKIFMKETGGKEETG